MKYERLFSPGKIGNLTIKNRLVMTAMGCGLANTDGTLNNEMIEFYRVRAEGGVGLIVTEVCRVNEEHGKRSARQISVTSDRHIPGLTALADAVHAYGTKVFVQLHHPGMWTSPALHNGNPNVTPSGVPSLVFPQPVRAITREEIRGLVTDFGDGAYRAMQAGIDGAEIHMAHFYLLHTFLSPYFNRRTDEYGGTLENRLRIVKEIVESIHCRCGPDFPLMARISAEEFIGDKGYHLDEGIRISKYLESIGFDAVDVTGGGAESGSFQSIEPISYREGWKDYLGKAVKKSVSIPVCMVSAIRTPSYANKLVEEETVDFIGMGRSFLADPLWPAKAASERESEICHCISCRRCIEDISLDKPIGCSINPRCGHEAEKSMLLENGGGRLVVVIGGGPAGLTAAYGAAKRGFRVVLFEKTAHLGGSMYLASRIPQRERLACYIDFLEKRCTDAGVDIQLNSCCTTAMIRELSPYKIVFAGGAQPLLPKGIPGLDAPYVYTPAEILCGKHDFQNESAVIVGAGLTGLETAEYLTSLGNSVTIYGKAASVGPGGDRTNVADCVRRLQIKDVIFACGRRLDRIENHIVYTTDITSGEKYELPADRVIVSLGVEPNHSIADEFQKKGFQTIIIGDAEKKGRLKEAVSAGWDAAMGI